MTDDRPLEAKIRDSELVMRAMRDAFRSAVIRHRQAGVPMSFQENEEIVRIPADQVHIEDDDKSE